MKKRDLKRRIRELEDEVAALRVASLWPPTGIVPLTVRQQSNSVGPPFCSTCGSWHWAGGCYGTITIAGGSTS